MKNTTDNKKIIDFNKCRIEKKTDSKTHMIISESELACDIPLSEMLFNPEKRQATFDYFDERYAETPDEREIFEAMRNKPYLPK